MGQPGFDELVDNIKNALVGEGGEALPLDAAYRVALQQSDARAKFLTGAAPRVVTDKVATDLLLMFDVVAGATSQMAARHQAGTAGVTPSEIIDIWIKASAARALWYERYVQSPSENSEKKLEVLLETAKKLGTEAAAQALQHGSQVASFTAFIADLARGGRA